MYAFLKISSSGNFSFFFFFVSLWRDYLLFGYGDIHIHREAWLYKYDMAVNHAETRFTGFSVALKILISG